MSLWFQTGTQTTKRQESECIISLVVARSRRQSLDLSSGRWSVVVFIIIT
jgi:hypothetical protein